ncbi:electron transport complex subunit RsxC [Shewanella fodinae]|uniref:Ion-translocating oxidoreductase complex subunit C n=1 Tax=Shewanella fodinae TaxID=552357 RepID=A0A4R2FFY6_9GAMM|nr:electron transport complex subunit RsxC [Shewanella fodinae]TCN80851.1 electron transport complex protein RnfC [Shewanella fodinae]
MSLTASTEHTVLWPLTGGIHPPEMKLLSNTTPIQRLLPANEYFLPLPQVGETAVLAVKQGQRVLKGQPLTRGISAMYLAVHAPTSGTITAIEPRPSNHPSALPVLTCVLQSDGLDEAVSFTAASEPLSHEQILQRIRDAGIAGMGGAMFPSHIKLNPASKIKRLIINGVECEPYITADDRLMREYASDILKGVALMQQLLQPETTTIAIEDNKPEAAQAMRQALAASTLPQCSIQVIPTKYPSGGEKQLIQILTGQEVPSGAIPAHLGIVVQNVGTAFAIQQAVYQGVPLLERVITVTGSNIEKPGNYWVSVGTPIRHILEQTGFKATPDSKVIVGGPMMGYTLPTVDVPVLKGSNCLLLPQAQELADAPQERSCIRCGECAQVCPVSLLPQQLYWHAKAAEYDKAENFHLQDCIECGCCSYVCPSDIPLVQYYRVAKAAIRKTREEKLHAEHAKMRFEARSLRMEQEKQEREAKAREAAEKRKSAMSGNEKDAVAAALARVKAKQATQGVVEESPAPTTADNKASIAAAVSGIKAQNQESSGSNVTNQEDKKAAIAAAIARAKAKKIAATPTLTETLTASAPAQAVADKQAKVAAALARAKAKKIQAADTSQAANNAEVQLSAPDATDKQAKIAATIAKAKARKAATENTSAKVNDDAVTEETSSEPTTLTESATDAAKKARIAAAVAKAKAKKVASGPVTEAPEKIATSNTVAAAAEQHAAKGGMPETATDSDTHASVSLSDDKKARVAAAVAKAKQKARERAREQENN